ncbi:MAG: D-glucuronyl C5-epimerase family protein [Ktedonobacteraceae bacterium]
MHHNPIISENCARGEQSNHSHLPAYPIDPRFLLDFPSSRSNTAVIPQDIPDTVLQESSHPTIIAQNALVHWRAYQVHGTEAQKELFLAQARWLLAHERRLANEAGGWPIQYALSDYYAPQHYLSALAQGCGISVLTRAYQLTQEHIFLETARRAVRVFEIDILDSGVQCPIGDEGPFFEEVAVYPAAHILSGYILALFGLYDYVACTQDSQIVGLIQRSLTALHSLLDEFDTGYWTYDDLLHRRLASQRSHTLHITLLEALARLSGCEHCAVLAKRWAGYQNRMRWRWRSWIAGQRETPASSKTRRSFRRFLCGALDRGNQGTPERVCVPINQFPISGGMKSVLAGIAQVMEDQWQMVYLTNYKGPDAAGLEIEVFGNRITRPWQFPGVWLYGLAGFSKLLAFLRRNPHCRLVLPQDGIFTGAFAAVAGKMAGARVICIDHGNIPTLAQPILRQERAREVQTYPWYKRIPSQLRSACYWPSLSLLARICTHFTDLYLIAGDETAEVCRQYLGIHPSRIIRYDFLVDMAHFPLRETVSRASQRAEQAIPAEAILITMINRLAIEKGMDTAIAGIAQALTALPPEVQTRVRVLIVGNGPLRAQVQADIRHYGLDKVCTLWGDANTAQVAMLLSISDIFLYNGTRGVNSMAVLEAMAAGCAVVASLVPRSNARLLAEGRGITIAPGDANAIATALIHLCHNPALCQHMGESARAYIATYHTDQMLKRNVWRATFFTPIVVPSPSRDGKTT